MEEFTSVLDDLAKRLEQGEDPSTLLDKALDLLAAVPPDKPHLVLAADEIVMALSATDKAPAEAVRHVLSRLREPDSTVGSSVWEDTAVTVVSTDALPDWVDNDMLGEFAESQRSGMAELERVALLGEQATAADEAELRRALHTLKGESATVGFDTLASLYHAIEDTLDVVGRVAHIADAALEIKDGILEVVDTFIELRDPTLDLTHLIALLKTDVGPIAIPPLAEVEESIAVGPTPVSIAQGSDSKSGILDPPSIAPVQPDPAPPPEEEHPLDAPSMWHEPSSITVPPEFDPSDPEMVELFREFYDEASESLLEADGLLMQLENNGPDEVSVNTLFRSFHTIKGLAGFLDMSLMRELAHVTETLLDLARHRLDALTPGRTDLILQATAQAKALLEGTKEGLQNGEKAKKPPGISQLLNKLRAASAPGWTDDAAPDGPPQQQPEPSAAAPTPAASEAEPSPQKQPEAGEAPPRTQAAPNRQAAVVVRESIKVDLQRVDNLVEIIGELVIVEAMVNNGAGSGGDPQQVRQQLAQLSKIVRALQRQGLALRMVPLRGVFQKMSRLVRDLSRRSSKSIKLEISGQDAEMDRGLADRLGDPLLHMIRNAVDHGIEGPEERLASGKGEVGTLSLSAYHEGGNIIIELSDDGRGLNRDKILAKATERGLVAPGAVLEDSEVWDLIFQPGFSTAEAVTEISGRGVGMDVVRRTVDDLRGRIQIESTLGKGSCFRFILPLTLAIIDGMLMRCGDGRFVLPTLSIMESFQPRMEQLHRFATGRWLFEMRGEQLPLV
ncbi:MAG: chemotaxis protein CheA, partial [Myxococcota bacterium]